MKKLSTLCKVFSTGVFLSATWSSHLWALDADKSVVPDSPGFVRSAEESQPATDTSSWSSFDPQHVRSSKPRVARKYHVIIQDGETAQTLTPQDKIRLGFVHSVLPSNFLSSFAGAGWGQIVNNRPHYGVDKGAFGDRLGAQFLKGTSQNLFNDSLYGNLLHEDTRYYVLGPRHALMKRAFYAAKESFVTRRDNGTSGIYWSNFASIASANILTNAYYPARDRNVEDTARSCLISVGTSILGNEFAEFTDDLFVAIFHRHR